MDYKDKWEVIDENAKEGGQGKVFKVIDKNKFNRTAAVNGIKSVIIRNMDININNVEIKEFNNYFNQLIQFENPSNYFALKVLHSSDEARDPKKQFERIKKEIIAMSEKIHPNLLRIIDYDEDEYKWFVSKYYLKGTLTENNNKYTGNFIESLKTFRIIVEAVASLHKKGYVHRDIKPDNIFIDDDNNLILGDFGLIYFEDRGHTRISEKFENVGSRDWMPPWAYGVRLEEVKPSSDVFSLGKVLWSMISDTPILQLWYYKDGGFNLEKKFSKSPFIKYVNKIFEKCIVEKEKDCLKDASELLKLIDDVLLLILKGADFFCDVNRHPCKFCGKGFYTLLEEDKKAEKNNFKKNIFDAQLIESQINIKTFKRDFGWNDYLLRDFKIFYCDYCGNVQWFYVPPNNIPEAWR